MVANLDAWAISMLGEPQISTSLGAADGQHSRARETRIFDDRGPRWSEGLGSIIVQIRTSFQARDADGSLLGVFASKGEALDAIWTSAGRARGGQDER